MVYEIRSPSLRPPMAEEYGSLGQSSMQAVGYSWCSATPFGIRPILGTIVAIQFLEVILGAHLVLEDEGKDVRVVSFDMHLLDGCRGRYCAVTGGVERKRAKRRKLGKSGEVAGRADCDRTLGCKRKACCL